MTDLGGNVKLGWVCWDCGKVDVMESNHPVTQLIDAAKGKGFTEVEATLEFLGGCGEHQLKNFCGRVGLNNGLSAVLLSVTYFRYILSAVFAGGT